MKDELDKPRRRALQYFYIDGTFEFTFSGLCLVLSAFFYVQAKLPESLISTILLWLFILIIPAGTVLISRLVNRFKEKITYPRTGYLSYQKPKGVNKSVKTGFGMGVTAVIGGLVAAIITGNPQALDWMPGLTSFVFAFVIAWIGFRSSLPRFLLLGFLLLLSGVLLSMTGFGNIIGLSLFFAIAGLLLLVSGTLTLLTYLRHHPRGRD